MIAPKSELGEEEEAKEKNTKYMLNTNVWQSEFVRSQRGFSMSQTEFRSIAVHKS